MRIGLIDIGSNTSKLLIAEKKHSIPRDPFFVLEQVSQPCRLLNFSPDHTDQIEDQEYQRLLACLHDFKKTCSKHGVHRIKAVATEAFRKAANAYTIRQKIKDEVGLEIEILSGAEEAIGVTRGLQTDPQIKAWQNYVALDIGGGSIEVIEVVNQEANQVKSLPIGAVCVAHVNQVDLSSKISNLVQTKARKYVDEIIQAELNSFTVQPIRLAATGGTIVFLRKIMETEGLLPKPGWIERAKLEEILQRACAVSTAERVNLFPDLPPDRADIFPFGLLAILAIMEFLKVDHLIHSFHNLRYGLAHDFLDSLCPKS